MGIRLVSSQVVLFDSSGKSEYHDIKYRSVVDVIIFIQQFNGLLLLLELNETDDSLNRFFLLA